MKYFMLHVPVCSYFQFQILYLTCKSSIPLYMERKQKTKLKACWTPGLLFSFTRSMRHQASALVLLSFLTLMLHLLLRRDLGTNQDHLHPQNLTLLLWHWPFGVSYSLEGNVCWSKFGIPGCFLEDNRTLFSEADVVVFHHHELWTGRSKLPLDLPRPPRQKWLWLSLEPPINNRNLRDYNGLFNWTMSYRRDADVFMPYGKLVPKKSNDSYLIPQKRNCLVGWVVSKYKDHLKRSMVYQELKHYIPAELIKVYGHWNKRPLSDKALLSTISQCSFYLAFENSVYRDYVTEKLWRNSLQAGSVPVVLGPPKANYELMVPPEAFIHVDDFTSVKELAAFLKQVASDRQSYESYFKWHNTHEVKLYTDWRERVCTVCAHYHKLPRNKVYQDLHSWGSQ